MDKHSIKLIADLFMTTDSKSIQEMNIKLNTASLVLKEIESRYTTDQKIALSIGTKKTPLSEDISMERIGSSNHFIPEGGVIPKRNIDYNKDLKSQGFVALDELYISLDEKYEKGELNEKGIELRKILITSIIFMVHHRIRFVKNIANIDVKKKLSTLSRNEKVILLINGPIDHTKQDLIELSKE